MNTTDSIQFAALRSLVGDRRFRLIALDMDGTLLNPEHRLCSQTIRAVRQVADSGVRVLLATARGVDAIHPHLSRLSTPGLVVAHNGALVVNLVTGEVHLRRTLDRSVAAQAILLAKRARLPVHFNTDERVVGLGPHPLSARYAEELGIAIDYCVEDALPVEPISVLLLGEPDTLRTLLQALQDAACDRFDYVLSPWPPHAWRLQLRAPGTSKGGGVFRVARQLGIAPREVVSFGDNLNDAEMIKGSGLGIAMGNAVPQIRQMAHFVTLSNAEQGVARALDIVFRR